MAKNEFQKGGFIKAARIRRFPQRIPRSPLVAAHTLIGGMELETIDDRIVNLTKNEISIIGNYKQVIYRIPASARGDEATVHFEREIVRRWKGIIPLVRITPDLIRVEGLPEPEEGVLYITSSVIAQHVRRPDVVSPDTAPGGIVKNGGNILGVKGLQLWDHSPVVSGLNERSDYY